jgi:vitamin B12 transporter
MKTPFTVAILAALSLPCSTSLYAETQLHPIVTASRIAQTADQTLTAVTVITSEDIEHSQSQSVAEILRDRVPGMDFLTTGGTGHQVSAFLRGTNSDHLLFMIDGNIIGSATTGSTALELIPVEQIERIEIIRGPRSSLYGSDAIGGVIQVFTKTGTDQQSASVTYGSHSTRAASASIGINSNRTQLNLSANHYKTDGFDVTNDSENDDDGYTNNAANINLKHSISNSSNINAQFFRAEGETEFDSDSFDNVSDSIQQNYSLGFDSEFTDQWSTSISAGQSKDRLETDLYLEDFFSPGTYNFSSTLFETKRDQAHWQNEVLFGDTGQAAFGIDYLNDKVESSTTFAETERNNKALYALVQDKFGKHQLQLSGRVDDNEAFGTQRTGSIAWSYDITGDLLVNLSHGTAFVAPSFNDLYFVGAFFSGNPDLDPETSRSTELGFTGNQQWGYWDFRTYHTEIEDLIVLNDSFTSVENADEAEINGAEFEVAGTIAGWDSLLNVSVIDPINKSTNTVLQGRAKRTLKMNIAQTFDGYRFSANVLAQSPRFANASNSIELAGYGVINLMVEKPINKHWSLETRLDNLMDKDYTTSIDFFGNTTNNTPISLFVTLSYLN